MNQQLQALYADARRIEAKTKFDIESGKLPHQPPCVEYFDELTGEAGKRAEFVWATSLRNLQHGTTAGDGVRGTLIMPIKLFSYRAAQMCFRLATPEEIAKQLEHQRQNKLRSDAEDLKRAKKFEIALPGEEK